VDASFLDIIDATLGSSGTLIGLMADFEARNGPVALFGDLVWTKIGVGSSGVRSRSLGPVGLSGAASADVSFQMAILEAGGAYEVARFGVGGPGASVALDVLAGGRFWYQKADLSFDLATTVDIGDPRTRSQSCHRAIRLGQLGRSLRRRAAPLRHLPRS
jgi:hypothetical protein